MDAYLFEKPYERNPLVFWFQSGFMEHKEIPFVEEYDVDMLSLTEFHVTVYEKSIIGCLNYMGQLMYFDKDGTVVESSTVKTVGIAEITGLSFSYVVLGKPLPVEDEQVFRLILNTSHLLEKYGLVADKIHFVTPQSMMIYFTKQLIIL